MQHRDRAGVVRSGLGSPVAGMHMVRRSLGNLATVTGYWGDHGRAWCMSCVWVVCVDRDVLWDPVQRVLSSPVFELLGSLILVV